MPHSFLWPDVSRASVIQSLSPISSLSGQTLPINQAHKILKYHITRYFPVMVVKRRNKIAAGCVAVGGYYYPDSDKAGNIPIYISLSYGPGEENITFTDVMCNRIKVLVADTIMHEIIHMLQYRSRNFLAKPLSENVYSADLRTILQKYYGADDEIEANAFNIACEVFTDGSAMDTCASMTAYHDAFGENSVVTAHVRHLAERIGSSVVENDALTATTAYAIMRQDHTPSTKDAEILSKTVRQ